MYFVIKGVIYAPDLVLVSEPYEYNLRKFLERSKGLVDIRQKFLWAEQISEALKKIHEQEIIHYYFYIHNIFVGFNKEIKIGPFSKFDFVPSDSIPSGCAEPFAPEHWGKQHDEIKKSELHTEASNVYFLVLVLIQIFTDIMIPTPFPSDSCSKEQVLKKFPSEFPEDIKTLITTGLDEDYSKRPPASKVWAAFFSKNHKLNPKQITTSAYLTNG